MNIFILSRDPILAAQYQCDKHVVKMCLETAQILSTINGGPYKPTHPHHPCTVWARSSQANYEWLWMHGMALCEEYTHLYGKRHKSQDVIEQLSIAPVSGGELTEHIQCMPDQYKCADVVEAYRAYYRGDKEGFAKWTKRKVPDWWNNA